MKTEHYPYSADEGSCFFEFESIGPKGVIKKVIFFDQSSRTAWNLAFGDKLDDDWSDSIVSNNNDLIKVMATVVAAAIEFSEKHPKRVIQIRPVDDRRRLLYNQVFRRNHEDFKMVFDIFGQKNKRFLPYDPSVDFDLFLLSRKGVNFVKK